MILKGLDLDLFYDCLPAERRLRMHFHRFMRRVHQGLTRLSGTADPLKKVAAEFAEEADVLCFDEFFVSDIGDAMILAEVLAELFDLGVSLIATSNVEPKNLYENGLQRRRFLSGYRRNSRTREHRHRDSRGSRQSPCESPTLAPSWGAECAGRAPATTVDGRARSVRRGSRVTLLYIQ